MTAKSTSLHNQPRRTRQDAILRSGPAETGGPEGGERTMANFEAVTASNGLKVLPEQAASLKGLLDKYATQSDVQMEFKDNQLDIYGYGWLNVYPRRPDSGEDDGETDYDAEANNEFLDLLRPFVPEGQMFVIQSIGSEKCIYPLSAIAVVVTKDKVEWHELPG